MRSFFVVLLLAFLGSAASAQDGTVAVVRVWPGYRTAESFDRIGTYFSGTENPAGETLRRSQPATRAGYYFLVRLKNPGAALAGATFELRVVTPDSPKTRIFTFQADVPPGSQAFDLGLTGSDWSGAKTSAVAWLLTVRSPAGTEIAHQQSFLWAEPAATP